MPQKVITCNMAGKENILFLGLEEKLVGQNVRTNPAAELLPEIEDAFYRVTEIERAHELAIANEAELLVGQISSFREDTWGSCELFDDKSVYCYVISGTIVDDGTIEDIYYDIESLGKSFKVEDRSAELIAAAKAVVKGVTDITETIEEEQKLKAFVMDSFNGNILKTPVDMETVYIGGISDCLQYTVAQGTYGYDCRQWPGHLRGNHTGMTAKSHCRSICIYWM